MKTIRFGIASLLMSAAYTFPPLCAQTINQRFIDYPKEGVALGNGWSTLAAFKTPGSCIEFKEITDVSEDRILNLQRVVDKDQLNHVLSVSVEFQAKSISGIGGSAKATYSNSLELKNESLNLMLNAKVLQGASFVSAKDVTPGIQLTTYALGLATNNMSQFIAQCGDSYVASIYRGGELNGFLAFNISSTDERETVAAAMSGAGVTFSGSASVNNTMSRYKESNRLQILMHSAGGTGVPIPSDEKELLERLKSLPADAAKAPKPYQISIARYDSLGNWPATSLVASNIASIELLVAQYQRFSSLYYDAASMLSNPKAYVFRGTLTLDSVRTLQDQLRTVIIPVLTKRIKECLAQVSCAMPTEGQGLDYALRTKMPVLHDSFAEDAQLHQLSDDQISTSTAFDNAPNIIYLKVPFQPNGLPMPNPAKAQLKAKLDGLNAALATANAAYPAALTEAMYKQWIATPSYYRCIENVVSDHCLSEASLAIYKAEIAQLIQ